MYIDEFKVISVMNDATLKVLMDKNADYQENLKIKEYLKDEALFFKIDQTNAYKILLSVGVKQEKLEKVYKKLTSADTYFHLLNTGKIKDNDDLILKYNKYRS